MLEQTRLEHSLQPIKIMQLTIITTRGMTSHQQQRVFSYTAVDETDPQTIQFHRLNIIQPQTTWYLETGTLITLKAWKELETTGVLGITTGEDALLVSEYETTLPVATVPIATVPDASVPAISQERRVWLEALADFHGEGMVPRSSIPVRMLIAPSPERKELLDQKFPFISTPSHGYIKVHTTLLDKLGLYGQISPYSPTHGAYRFLEEDCDAYKFICTLANALGKTRYDVMEENFEHVEQLEIS